MIDPPLPRTPDEDPMALMVARDESVDCVPAGGVTPLRVMLCVVHYAVSAWVVSITPRLVGSCW
jgi:hypothetical protein